MVSRAVAYTALGGFHVRFTVLLSDVTGFPVSSSIPAPTQRIGVDGTLIGESDRTVPWEMRLTAEDAARVEEVTPMWSWDPDSLLTILAKWNAAATSVANIAEQVGRIGRPSASSTMRRTVSRS
jgi:hypothetical protein